MTPSRLLLLGKPSGLLNLQTSELLCASKISHLEPSRFPTSLWILLLAGDIEVDPGPRQWRFPCEVCSAPVKNNQKGVQCDVCDSWLHARCIGLSTDDYAKLQSSDDNWCREICLNQAIYPSTTFRTRTPSSLTPLSYISPSIRHHSHQAAITARK